MGQPLRSKTTKKAEKELRGCMKAARKGNPRYFKRRDRAAFCRIILPVTPQPQTAAHRSKKGEPHLVALGIELFQAVQSGC